MLRRFALLVCALGLACASQPNAPAPGHGHVFGEVRLVPRAGVAPAGACPGGYGDRRLNDVEFVDYSRPGFAVVYVDGPAPAGRSELSIHGTAVRARLSPSHAALGSGGTIVVRNASDGPHVVSLPAASYVAKLGPGEVAEIPVPRPGELRLFLLDEPGAEARLFAAPGPFAVASRSGRFQLEDLVAGRHELRVWHPRFPPTSHRVDLPADGVLHVDLALGVQVGPGAGETDAADR